MRLNKYEISIIAFIIFVIFGVAYHTQPFAPAKAKISLENRIEAAEDYYQEAKALSLSMPLLNDSAVAVISDSLMIILVELNHSWVIYVRTQKGFENYTEEIKTLNNNIEKIRVEYEVAKGMRSVWRNLRIFTPRVEKRKTLKI